MFNCLTSSLYSAKAEVLAQVVQQNPDTGEFIKSWELEEIVPCNPVPIYEEKSSDIATGKRPGERYRDLDMLRIECPRNISKRYRIGEITNDLGVSLWPDPEKIDGRPIIWEVDGSIPILDPFSNVIGYELILRKAHVQEGN